MRGGFCWEPPKRMVFKKTRKNLGFWSLAIWENQPFVRLFLYFKGFQESAKHNFFLGFCQGHFKLLQNICLEHVLRSFVWHHLETRIHCGQKEKYSTSSDHRHGISRHILSHILWFWHVFWHLFWHSICHSFWHSIWHLFLHSIWHSTWYIPGLAVRVRRGTLRSCAYTWGPAGNILILSLLFGSGGEQCDLALAVHVQRGTLWSWLCCSGPVGNSAI